VNQREAKHIALGMAASVLHTAMAEGWPRREDIGGPTDEDDLSRVLYALDQIIEELHDRSLGYHRGQR